MRFTLDFYYNKAFFMGLGVLIMGSILFFMFNIGEVTKIT